MSDNWVVQNLENALETWNEKLAEIWQLLTQSPENFKGGTIWNVIKTINGTVQAIGLALLVLFFVVGIVKTCGSFAEVKKPEVAIKLFVRFALAKAVVTYGLELGSGLDRRIVHHNPLVYHDPLRLRALFQTLYLHSYRASTAGYLCR